MQVELDRRTFIQGTAASVLAAVIPHRTDAIEGAKAFKFKYMVSSCLYGYTDLETLLPEVRKAGAEAIDIWPMVHGNQREQIDAIGEEKFQELLQQHQLTLGCLSQYKLGPFALKEELQFAKRLGCPTIVTNAKGPTKLSGADLKTAITKFVEQFKPTLASAAESNATIAIENHASSLVDSADSIKWLRELCPDPALSFALAPYHLEQAPTLISDLVRFLDSSLSIFYAWQHGNGSMQQQPKETELLQLPGKGPLDFGPIVQALQSIRYEGWTEVFMHSFPRGTAVHDTPQAVTAEVNLARQYLERFIK